MSGKTMSEILAERERARLETGRESEPVTPQPVLQAPVSPAPVAIKPLALEPVSSRPAATEPASSEPVADTPAHIETRAPITPRPVPRQDRSADEGGYTMWPNSFWDEVCPTLDTVDQAVLAHLYRLTAGFDRETATISLPRLAERCKSGLTLLRNALKRLERRGLVERVSVEVGGRDYEMRGIEWRVNIGRVQPGKGTVQRNRSRSDTPAPARAMKDTSKYSGKEDSAPLYRIREIALRLREAGKGSRAELEAALVAAGIEYDAALVDEAIAPFS